MFRSLEVRAFHTLCGLLGRHRRTEEIEDDLAILGRADAYKHLLDLSYNYLLTPAIYPCLERHGIVDVIPGDLRDFLRQAHHLNRDRNSRIKDQATEVVETLRATGIDALLLKGAAHLYQCPPSLSGERMIGDIDVLINAGQVSAAVGALRRLGYEGDETAALTRRYHDIGLEHPGRVTVVDLHIDVGQQCHLLTPEAAMARSLKIRTGEGYIAVPDATVQVFHNVFHGQIQDRHHEVGEAVLRQLHDLRMILDIYADRIEWGDVANLMGSARYKEIARHYLYQANGLLGLAIPDAYAGGAGARVHFARCAMQRRLPVITKILKFHTRITGEFYRCRLEYVEGRSLGRYVLWARRFGVLFLLVAKYRWRIVSRVRREWP